MQKIASIILCLMLVFLFGTVKPKVCYAENNISDNELKTTAQAMCVTEKISGRVLYSHNENQKLPMASLTKIITAIVVIENNKDLNKIVTIPKQAQGIEGSTLYLKEGEEITIKDLLYGLMLRSGNDSSVALAIETSGSVEKFMELANKFCVRLGALNTNLVNPNGLHDDNHYTTAKDLAIITSYALKNPTFAKIVATKKTDIVKDEKIKPIKNKNKLLLQLESATGVKTGYTKKAGRCFVGSAKHNDMEVICVLLNCNDMFEECTKLLDMAFNNYELVNVVNPYTNYNNVPVINSKQESVKVYSQHGFSYPVTKEEKNNLHVQVFLPAKLKAPIKNGQAVGKLDITIANDLLFSEKIYTINSVEANDYFSNVKKIVKNFI